MDFDSWMAGAWAAHADDPAGTAARIAVEGADLARSDAQLARLAQLAHHLWGEHLGDAATGRQALLELERHPAHNAGGTAAHALRLYRASLALVGGDAAASPAWTEWTASDRLRIQALAASAAVGRDTGLAASLFGQALALAEASALGDDDPALRALAAAANNLACTLEARPARGDAERELMVVAAQAARRYWERAGGWLEVQRAEYRLAMSWLAAGDTDRARRHAERCLASVDANTGPAFERFFGWEALAAVERAAGRPQAHATALARAREAWEALDAADREACAASLQALERPTP